jgi:hypothetical protein
MSHGAAEFTFDFITRFFPNATVAARVFLAAPQVPKLLESLTASLGRYKVRMEQAKRDQPPPRPDEPPLSHPPM